MLLNKLVRFCVSASLALVAAALSQAQSPSGSVAGFVNNAGTGDRLQSANVELQPLGRKVVTDFEGRYLFVDVPAGDYKVSANYAGLDTVTRDVSVAAGQRADVIFDLSSDVYKLDKFVVNSEREGNAASITRQRNAPNVKNVVALDAYGNVPNDSIGEVLIRMPGIAGRSEDSGEVTGAVIRGAAVGLNTVSIDGNLQSSIGGLGREFRTNTLSGALFEEIEVIKGVTPDMPSDSLGGAVNMKTRSALQLKEKRRFNYRAAVRVAPEFYPTTPMREEHRMHPQTSFGYQEVFDAFGGRRNLAVSFNTFYSENVYSNGQVIQDYQATTTSPAFVWDYRTADSYNSRKQGSANLRVDYKLSDHTQIFIGGIYNDAMEPLQRLYTSRAYNNQAGANVAPGYTDDFTQVNPSANSRVQLNTTMYSFLARERQMNVGAKHEFNRLKIDYDAYYNHSNSNLGNGKREGVTGGGIFTMDVRNVGWTIDKSGSDEYPVFTQTTGANVYDGASYGTGAITIRDSERNTRVYGAKGNASYLLPWSTPTTLKTGFFFRNQMAEEVKNEVSYTYAGAAGTLKQFVYPDLETSDSRRTGKPLPFVDASLVVKDIKANPSNWRQALYADTFDNLIGTRDISEEVSATFLQGQSQFGKLGVLTGVRFERTEVESHGRIPAGMLTTTAQRTADPIGSAILDTMPRTNSGSYDDLFPSIHFTYAITSNLQARASWSNSIGRAPFTNLLANATINETTRTISIGNPSLKPQYSENWDASLEYYFKPVGVFSVGYFRKNLADYIVTGLIGKGEDLGYTGDRASYDLFSSFNGGSATVKGWEFSYSQTLSMLPSVLKTLSIFANYTYLTTDGDYGETGVRSTSEVAGFYPRTGNAGLNWKYRKLGLSASVNHTGVYLATYAADASRLRYRFERNIVNFGATYNLNRTVNFFADLQNAFNEPNSFYRYKESQVERITTAGTTIVFGINGRF
ncbi:TonB-dependent receptor [Oleiharenicola lentus]|uniref:TonB-dependent receptor n=1 Tax=Oleiharenicola lentus TaxID=2508720 RepID=UPI003F664FBA